jgi:phosphatidate cytidylyltransferase
VPQRWIGYLVAVAWALGLVTEAQATAWGYADLEGVSAANILAAGSLLAVAWLTITLHPSREKFRLLRSPRFATLLGLFYVPVPLFLLVWVCVQNGGPRQVLFALIVIWIGDTTAYFVGRSLGRRKLAPHVSPNKTWEGTVASFVVALLVGFVSAGFSWDDVGYMELTLLAAALNVAGQLGDLAESALKRSAGVKDSSHLIPGHGGVLDRIDALLFASPVLWYYWLWRIGG